MYTVTYAFRSPHHGELLRTCAVMRTAFLIGQSTSRMCIRLYMFALDAVHTALVYFLIA